MIPKIELFSQILTHFWPILGIIYDQLLSGEIADFDYKRLNLEYKTHPLSDQITNDEAMEALKIYVINDLKLFDTHNRCSPLGSRSALLNASVASLIINTCILYKYTMEAT